MEYIDFYLSIYYYVDRSFNKNPFKVFKVKLIRKIQIIIYHIFLKITRLNNLLIKLYNKYMRLFIIVLFLVNSTLTVYYLVYFLFKLAANSMNSHYY